MFLPILAKNINVSIQSYPHFLRLFSGLRMSNPKCLQPARDLSFGRPWWRAEWLLILIDEGNIVIGGIDDINFQHLKIHKCWQLWQLILMEILACETRRDCSDSLVNSRSRHKPPCAVAICSIQYRWRGTWVKGPCFPFEWVGTLTILWSWSASHHKESCSPPSQSINTSSFSPGDCYFERDRFYTSKDENSGSPKCSTMCQPFSTRSSWSRPNFCQLETSQRQPTSHRVST